jgi:hypothetical protein
MSHHLRAGLDAISRPDAHTDLETWTLAVCDCAGKVGPVLGLVPFQVVGRIKTPPTGLSGMAITLEGKRPLIRIGVLTNGPGQVAIARALFQMGPTETPSDSDGTDALGELANVISGHVKASMSAVDTTMRLGLPTRVGGDALSNANETITLRVSFGGVPAALVVAAL